MGLDKKKKRFLDRYKNIEDEQLIDKLQEALVYYESRLLESDSGPISTQELISRAQRSNSDIEAGRVISHEDLERAVANW